MRGYTRVEIADEVRRRINQKGWDGTITRGLAYSFINEALMENHFYIDNNATDYNFASAKIQTINGHNTYNLPEDLDFTKLRGVFFTPSDENGVINETLGVSLRRAKSHSDLFERRDYKNLDRSYTYPDMYILNYDGKTGIRTLELVPQAYSGVIDLDYLVEAFQYADDTTQFHLNTAQYFFILAHVTLSCYMLMRPDLVPVQKEKVDMLGDKLRQMLGDSSPDGISNRIQPNRQWSQLDYQTGDSGDTTYVDRYRRRR